MYCYLCDEWSHLDFCIVAREAEEVTRQDEVAVGYVEEEAHWKACREVKEAPYVNYTPNVQPTPLPQRQTSQVERSMRLVDVHEEVEEAPYVPLPSCVLPCSPDESEPTSPFPQPEEDLRRLQE